MRSLKDYQLLLAGLVVAGGVVFHKLYDCRTVAPPPDAGFDVQREAKGYARDVMSGYGDSCSVAAGMIRAGTSFEDAQTALRAKWKEKGQAAFQSRFGKHLGEVIPEGTTPSPAQREAMAAFLDDLGKGVRQ